jgi:hypothetical protein
MSSISTGCLIHKRRFRASAVALTCLITVYLLWESLFYIPNPIDISNLFMPGSTKSLFFTATSSPEETNSQCSSKVLKAVKDIEITVTEISGISPNLQYDYLKDMVVRFKVRSLGWVRGK